MDNGTKTTFLLTGLPYVVRSSVQEWMHDDCVSRDVVCPLVMYTFSSYVEFLHFFICMKLLSYIRVQMETNNW